MPIKKVGPARQQVVGFWLPALACPGPGCSEHLANETVGESALVLGVYGPQIYLFVCL